MNSQLPPLERASFVLASNGFADSPAQALREYLISRRAGRVTLILHPLVPEDPSRHEVWEWRSGELIRKREMRLPSRPPLTYPFDLVIPPVPPAGHIWFGFNCLATAAGIAARRFGRVGHVVYWCVDYVDDRFGRTLMTRAYEALEGYCCRHADARFELSEEARHARDDRHSGRPNRLAPTRIVPMGAWTERTPTTSDDGFKARRIVFMGHLVPNQGVPVLIAALSLLRQRGVAFTADVIGRGPQASELRELAGRAGLADLVTFRGFIADHRDLERMLAEGSIGVAPYDTDSQSFKRFADPGKLKAYAAAGLPIITTDVAPNARALEQEGSAQVVCFSAEAVALAIESLLSSPTLWRGMRSASLRVASAFDWNLLIGGALKFLGIESESHGDSGIGLRNRNSPHPYQPENPSGSASAT